MVKAKEMTKEHGDWVKENLRYDPETGYLWWTKQNIGSGPRRDLNRPAGNNKEGYLCVNISLFNLPTTILLHRVAWYLTYNVWPKDQLDHINNVKDDNRIVNLREATSSENGSNKKLQKGGTSQYKGVYWNKQNRKWHSTITLNYKQTYLGYYDTEEEAALVYNKAALEYFGEFAKINIIEPLDTGITNTYISSSSGELTC